MAKNKKADPAVKEEVVQAKQPKPENEPLMYVGPTIAGVAIQNRVYKGIPEGLKQAIEEMPEFGNLLLPVKDYAMAEEMIRTGQGFVASAYRRATHYKKGGND